MAPKLPRKSKVKLTDAERHARFKAMAREVAASDDLKEFDKAFRKITKPVIRES